MRQQTKKNPLPLLFAFLVSFLWLTQSTFAYYAGDAPHLTFSVEEISPVPAQPGQDVTVKLRVMNDGTKKAEHVSLRLLYDNPFFLKTKTDNLQQRDLCAGCSIENTYYFTLNPDAQSGIYSFNVEIAYDGVVLLPEDTVDIKVVGKPDLVLATHTMNQTIAPGESFNLTFSVMNIGTGKARNIKIIPNSENIFLQGANLLVKKELLPEHQAVITASFMVKKSLSPDSYTFPLTLRYEDEQGTSYETTYTFGITLLEKAELDFQSMKITPQLPTVTDTLFLEGIVENVGEGKAKKTMVILNVDGKNYTAFLGELKADDDAPFYFTFSPKTIGELPLQFTLYYDDDFGTHRYSKTILLDIGRPKQNLGYIIAGVLLLIAGALAFYKKRHK